MTQVDFMRVGTRSTKRGVIEIYPKFIVDKSEDLMIRGGDFYAVWIEEQKMWSTNERDALAIIDKILDEYAEANRNTYTADVRVLHMWDAENGMIDRWLKYCQRQSRDDYHMLDEKIIFSNQETRREDYASKKLDYPLEKGDISAYNRLMTVLYEPEERQKLEWAIGAVVCGDSKWIQKFIVLYGAAGTGKSTVLNIIQMLFEGYYSVFDAKSLGSANSSFALEPFRTNPLVAIQHDGDLSKIEDNTRLNSLISHELMTVNEKFKSTYANRFKCFLFMGTNKPVKITDAKSGLIRRLIDVSPSGNKLPVREYNSLIKQIKFELGAIAYHCKEVYLQNKSAYDNYIPVNMLGASNDFFNFVLDSFPVFKKENGVSMKAAWEMYKTYCEEAKVSYPYPQRVFKEELKNYFDEYKERYSLEDGTRIRSYYTGFKESKIIQAKENQNEDIEKTTWLEFKQQKSILDEELADCPAQYANAKETPVTKWENVRTKLADIDTSKTHYVKPPEVHAVIDFDLTDENGNKSLAANIEEASKWPPTYAELSKSGCGIHLHYKYIGDLTKVSRVYSDHVEIKVFNGNSSLRRKLTKCNDLPIATLSSGLPIKTKGKKMVNFEAIKNESGLRRMIIRNLNKQIHPNTKPSIDFIDKILNDAYYGGLKYDVTDMRNNVLAFAVNSTNNRDKCVKIVNQMKFKSEEPSENIDSTGDIVFFDIEVFPNLFLVNWKYRGEGKSVVRMINPSQEDIIELAKMKLVGFNCRRYDNHLLYARIIGYNNEQLYKLSQNIISGRTDCFFGEAYNLSYTDVYDFCSKKQSLKKWEIELGISHKELELPWDKPVPEELWTKVAEYCDNDVLATEAVFNARKADFKAREILADVAGLSVNDTTNTLTETIVFGKNVKNPQNEFNYRNMGEFPTEDRSDNLTLAPPPNLDCDFDYTVFDQNGMPIFPGYTYENGVSTYRDEEVGEGGYVYAEPGIYYNIALLDIASMHPSSIVAEKLFGDKFTKKFEELLKTRIYIKHKKFYQAKKMLGGKLSKYLDNEEEALDLAQALKIAINSVYGLTAAGFKNPFRDKRNVDNIVAKRGALFMVNLKHEVQHRGFTVAHIKTDSIKIPNATKEIIKFVMDYGKLYGYNFEHECTYDRMCLVNDAVYIAKLQNNSGWTATGTQFQVPYVFKTLFSKENITFKDKCETKSVSKGAIYLDLNEDFPDVTAEEKQLDNIDKQLKKIWGSEWREIDDAYYETKDLTDKYNELKEAVKIGHNYIFIGRVGQFCPIKEGCGGGTLYRMANDKYYAISGTKGYHWLESAAVKLLKKEEDIDESYYITLVDDAVETISKYGDFEQFVNGVSEDFMNVPEGEDEELPFN